MKKTFREELEKEFRRYVLVISILILIVLAVIIFEIIAFAKVIGEASSLSSENNEKIENYLETFVETSEEEIVVTTSLVDERIDRVATFFEKRGSDLSQYSSTFVEVADKNGIDYRLLPAIATIESGAGKSNFRDFNPFGWGNKDFNSYEEAIEVVGRGMGHYYENGLDTVEEIAPIYCPPNSIVWKNSVNYFISLI